MASAQTLNAHLKDVLPSEGRSYVLLDEIQEVTEWERLVNSLLADGRTDLYITGSNSRLLSGEITTYIAGRYVTIEVWPLSFREYLSFRESFAVDDMADTGAEFTRYLRLGGFPGVHMLPLDEADARSMIMDIYRSTLVRDVFARNRVRDAEMFERVAAFAIDNVDNPFSVLRSTCRCIHEVPAQVDRPWDRTQLSDGAGRSLCDRASAPVRSERQGDSRDG
ncbi:ATP-binding protein [Brevibacterium permense]|nr:ATP-binding protein [Brevibacterium permense]